MRMRTARMKDAHCTHSACTHTGMRNARMQAHTQCIMHRTVGMHAHALTHLALPIAVSSEDRSEMFRGFTGGVDVDAVEKFAI